jgi:hypothetical protein
MLPFLIIGLVTSACHREKNGNVPKHTEVSFYIMEGPHGPKSDSLIGRGSAYHLLQRGSVVNPVVEGSASGNGPAHAIQVNFRGQDHNGNDRYQVLVDLPNGPVTEKLEFNATFQGKPLILLDRPEVHIGIAPSPPF